MRVNLTRPPPLSDSISTLSTVRTNAPCWGALFSLYISTLNLTSSGPNDSPSCHSTPSRRSISTVVSSTTSAFVASAGTISSCGEASNSPS